jgi:uncharacterized YigZ family protein
LNKHQYNQPKTPSTEVLYKDKGSKFFGYVFPVNDEGDVQNALDQLKAIHSKARHFCYAWQLGTTYDRYRVNDDGEPSNSAGMPIYGQIQAKELTNCLIVVVRYFGGTKLGVGGLISAYKTTASLALDETTIITKDITKTIIVKCGYDLMNEVMRLVKELNLNILKQDLTTDCTFYIEIPLQGYENTLSRFKNIYGLSVS